MNKMQFQTYDMLQARALEVPTQVTIKVQGSIVVQDAPIEIQRAMATALTFQNKAYTQALKYGRYIPRSMPKTLSFWARDPDGTMFLPKGFITKAKRILEQNKIRYRIEDNTLKMPLDKPLDWRITLRGYQEDAFRELKKYPVGVLRARTGAGKTITMLRLIQHRNQRTLVIVHNKELMYQWQEAAFKAYGIQTGLIGDGKYQVRPITIGIVNSVQKHIQELKDSFGMVVMDECHRVASTTFTKILPEFRARYTNGATATDFRSDGLDEVIFAYLGPLLHVVPDNVLIETGAVLKPEIHRIKTNFRCPVPEYLTIIQQLSKNEDRNRGIVQLAKMDLKTNDQAILIAVERVQMGKDLAGMLQKDGIQCELLHGSVAGTERERIVHNLKSGVTRVLIATISLIGEGFDMPGLGSLLLASPVKFKGRVIQTIGRILRPKEGKVAKVYDLRDDMVPILQRQGRMRDKTYREQEWL